MAGLTRRRFLTTVAATAGAGILAARCGGGRACAGWHVTDTGRRRRAEYFHFASTIPALSIDPHQDVTMGLAYTALMYGYPLSPVSPGAGRATRNIRPRAVVGEPGRVTYVFKMRPGIHFQDLSAGQRARGDAADDVVYSFQRIGSLDSTTVLEDGDVGDIGAGREHVQRASFERVCLRDGANSAARERRSSRGGGKAVRRFEAERCRLGPFQLRSLSPTESIADGPEPDLLCHGHPLP